MKIISNSRLETIRLGQKLAKRLRPGQIVLLSGNLGAGKTTFTKGLAKGLGIKDVNCVISPSFVIIREHKGKTPLYHIDLYRLSYEHIHDLGLEEYFRSNGICVIEWPDRLKDLTPKNHILIKFATKSENKRLINIIGLK